MIEFFKKNQKNITMGGAVALLLICYFQQKELPQFLPHDLLFAVV